MKPLHHFYHIYADGNCETPIREHIRAMKEYGLYNALTTFAIGIVGSQQKRDEVKACLNSLDVKYIIAAEADQGWEQVTQIPMWEFSKENDGYILYAHTKGASNGSEVNVRWRRSMIYWNVIRWQDCLEHLKDHEMTGTHWIYPLIDMPEHKWGNPMMAGTFYWVWATQMRTWMKPPLTHRWEAEGWCGYGYVKKPFRIWDWAPYFPNSNEFGDGWVNNPNFIGATFGRTIEPEEHFNRPQ